MAFPFDSTDTLSPEAESLQRGFSDLREKLAAEAKCVPDDREDLLLEKQEWCRRWNKISSDIGLIMAAGKDKGVALLLTAEEIALGKEMAGVHDRFVDEMRIIKDQAARQAEIQELQGAGPDVTMDGDGEEELEDEEEAPPKRPEAGPAEKVTCSEPDADERGVIVVHEMKCARCETRELECAGPEGQGVWVAGLLSQVAPIHVMRRQRKGIRASCLLAFVDPPRVRRVGLHLPAGPKVRTSCLKEKLRRLSPRLQRCDRSLFCGLQRGSWLRCREMISRWLIPGCPEM
ncbi:hypothetical protein EDB19DRAFT_1748199, partial [Suillus lakei]